MVTFQKETAYTLLREAKDLFAQHYLEEASQPDIPMDLDTEKYLRAYELGQYRVYTVRDTDHDDKLVGYGAFVVVTNIQAKTSLNAMLEALYLDHDYRGGTTAVRFLTFIKEQLKADGVQLIRMHASPEGGFAHLLTKMQYTMVKHEFELRLDKE